MLWWDDTCKTNFLFDRNSSDQNFTISKCMRIEFPLLFRAMQQARYYLSSLLDSSYHDKQDHSLQTWLTDWIRLDNLWSVEIFNKENWSDRWRTSFFFSLTSTVDRISHNHRQIFDLVHTWFSARDFGLNTPS